MLKTFLILIAIASTFKLLVSSGHQVFVLLLVDLKGTWWPPCALSFFTYYSWHMVATKYRFFESWMRWPPNAFFLVFCGLGGDLVAMTKSLFPLLLIGVALGGHESPFFISLGIRNAHVTHHVSFSFFVD